MVNRLHHCHACVESRDAEADVEGDMKNGVRMGSSTQRQQHRERKQTPDS